MSVDIATISTLIASICTVFFACWAIKNFYDMKKIIRQYQPTLDSVGSLLRYEEDDKGQPMLDARLVKMIDALGSRVTQSFTMSGLAQLSGVKRMEKGLKGAMAADIVEQKMPILNLIGDFMGINTMSYIKKHPDAMGQILQMAGPFLQNVMGNNGQGQAASKLRSSFG